MTCFQSLLENHSLHHQQATWGNGEGSLRGIASSGQEVDPHLVSLRSPGSFEAEQYRTLRYVVEVLHKNEGLRVVAVTSPVVADGKTTTAINLAGSLAQAAEARILLICADLRRPSLPLQLGLARRQEFGLADLILDTGRSLIEVVQQLPAFNLSIVPAGRASLHAYEILKSPRVGDLFAEARQHYDYVIVDTPPLVIVPDSRLISQWVDGFLLVVAAHKTPRKFVAEALNLMVPEKVIGLVFNGDDRPLSGYYGYYQPYGQSQAPARSGWWRRLAQAFRLPSQRS